MLTDVENRITYSGNGNATEFAYQFKILDRTDIKVLLTDADGKEKLLTKDYYVDVEKNVVRYPGYAVGAEVPESERPAVLPTGWKLTIYREVPVTQETDLPDQYPFNQVEAIGDKLTMIAQQLTDVTSRSLKISVSKSADIDTAIPFEAGKSFRIADDGKSIVLTEDPARVLPLAQKAYAQAQAQAQSASASAAAAAKSEDSAAASASEAGNSAQSASVSAASAAESARLAEGYKNVAETAKSDAALYANNAKTSADNATASKEAAQSAANSASNFATDARSSANEAKSYRDAASTYATNAKNYSENVNVFVPSVSAEGVLSWSNKAGLPNPPSVNIKGKDGADGGVTVDTELSSTSTNPVQNKVIYSALDNKLGKNSFAYGALRDAEGNFITSTYVRSVNGVKPDIGGNVTINVSGGGSSITVDAELSETSINPVQNKVIKGALDDKANLNKNNTFSKDNYFQKGISLIAYRDLDSAIKWYQSTANPPVASIDATNYTGNAASATKATQDSEGNVITETYAKKADVSDVVKSVNGTKPDASGNVSIAVSGGSNVTVDTTLSATSTNAIQNKAVYAALSDKLDKSDVAIGAQRALQDGDGNIISLTYVKSVNGTKPDSNGNVSISTSGGDGGGASTSTQNTWTALQNFHDLMLNREKYATFVVNGTSDKPVASTMVYAVIGAFTLDLATLAGLLSASQSSVFTAYFAANADYSLTINNAGKLKYVGSASDIAITSAGLLLNIWMSKDGEGTLTSIVQASKLS